MSADGVVDADITCGAAEPITRRHCDLRDGHDGPHVSKRIEWPDPTAAQPKSPAEVLDEARRELIATGHTVTDDLSRDVDRAIDLERTWKEDERRRIAMALGHSLDYARSMTLTHLLDAVRTTAMEADRCSSCPWPRGTECGGAASVCEGNARPGEAPDA